MRRSIALLALLALFSSACAATFPYDPFAAGEARLASDARLYASAYRIAVLDYESEPESSFETCLARSLADIGLTPRGFRQYQAHHPEFTAALDAEFADRLAARAAPLAFPTNGSFEPTDALEPSLAGHAALALSTP